MKNPLSGNKKGYLLPMVIIYMVTAMIVGTGIVLLGSLDRIEANKRLHREQAFYLAEAGINLARYDLKNSIPLPTDPQTVNSGTWTGTFVLSETGTDTITVTSTGTVKGNTETIRLTVTIVGGGPFSDGIFGADSLIVKNNSVMDSYDSRLGPYGGSNVGSEGDAGSNSYISVSNEGIINGDASVSAGGNIMVGIQGEITGDTSFSADPKTLPGVIIPNDLYGLNYPVLYPTDPPGGLGDSRIIGSEYTMNSAGEFEVNGHKSVTISGGDFRFKKITVGIGSTLYITNTTGNSRFYIQGGGLHLSNNSQTNLVGEGVTAEIYVDTSIATLDNSASLNCPIDPITNLHIPGDPSHLGIYITSTQTQYIENNAFISAALYAPRAEVIIKNNGGFFGSVVAKSVVLDQNAKTHYDIALRTNPPPGDPGGGPPIITFVNWTKPDWKK